jgi:hypothetical protein
VLAVTVWPCVVYCDRPCPSLAASQSIVSSFLTGSSRQYSGKTHSRNAPLRRSPPSSISFIAECDPHHRSLTGSSSSS